MEKVLSVILHKKVIAPILILIATSIIYAVIKKVIKNMFKLRVRKSNEKRNNTLMQLITNIIKYFLFVIAFMMILEVYGVDTKSLIASLGVLSLVVGLALQDTLKDFVSGITIILEDQFSVGDTVTIGSFKGEVVSMGLKTTKLKSFDGQLYIVANRNIVEVINHSMANSLAIVDVPISYEDDLEKVEKVLSEACEKLTASLENLKGEVSLLGINSYDASSLAYRVTVETVAGEHFAIQRKLRKALYEELKKNGIEIPYNQLVVRNG